MRILFKTPAAAATFTDPRNGQRVSGKSWLEFGVFDEDDARASGPLARRAQAAQVLATVRGRDAAGRSLRSDPPPTISVPSVSIPADVLDLLPGSSRVALTWWFTPEGRS